MKILLLIIMIFIFWFSDVNVQGTQIFNSSGYLNHTREPPKLLRVSSGICPQPRKTEKAPSNYILRQNPLPDTNKNTERGKVLYQKEAKAFP